MHPTFIVFSRLLHGTQTSADAKVIREDKVNREIGILLSSAYMG
jgi:hypothetical protein